MCMSLCLQTTCVLKSINKTNMVNDGDLHSWHASISEEAVLPAAEVYDIVTQATLQTYHV